MFKDRIGKVVIDCETASPDRVVRLCGERCRGSVRAKLTQSGVSITVAQSDGQRAEAAVRDICGGLYTVRAKTREKLMRLTFHRALFAALLLAAAAGAVSRTFIWDVEVSGCGPELCEKVETAMKKAGAAPGKMRFGISSERVRYEVMTAVPELRNFALSINGQRAEATVRVRSETVPLPDNEPTDVTASRGGEIVRCVVTDGKAAVKAGDTVKAGDVLVSSVMDSLSSGERLVHAKAKVFAKTVRTFSVCSAEKTEIKRYSGEKKTRYALIFGTKRINLYFDYGNLMHACDKIISVKNTAVPFSVIREDYYFFDTVPSERPREEIVSGLEKMLTDELEKTGAEEIVSKEFSVSCDGGIVTVTLTAGIIEDIAQEQPHG